MKYIRIIRNLATLTAAAGIAVTFGAGAASAATKQIGIGCPTCHPQPTNYGAVSGTVNMGTCTVTPTIYVSSGISGQYATVTPVPQSTNTWQYLDSYVTPGNATVYPSGGCALGYFSPANVSTYVSGQLIASAPQLNYVMPAKTNTVAGWLIASGARAKFSDLKLHLNDYGPQVGNSHQANNSSYLSTGSTFLPFNISESSTNMKLCDHFFCPSLGHADFYVNDMNLSSTSFVWTASGTLQMTVNFESVGSELKGFYTNAAVGESDNGMPDANIDNGSVTVTLVPIADGAGGVSFVATGTPTFQGTIQASGACSVLGWDWCDSITGYKGTISTAFANAAKAAINSSAVQHEISASVRPMLDSNGIGYVTGISVQGANVVIASS